MRKSKVEESDARLKLMVSSTVYGIEAILDQIYALLTGFGYDVWMSRQGTIPVLPNQHAFDSCLAAVANCDLILAIITPQYGSGVVDGNPGITHQELLRAIELNKPRWILAHDRVIFARSLFRKLGCTSETEREAMLAKLGFNTAQGRERLRRREAQVIDDFRVIDMYDAATRQDKGNITERIGNWVQPFVYLQDVRRFVSAQFKDYQALKQRIDALKTASRDSGGTR